MSSIQKKFACSFLLFLKYQEICIYYSKSVSGEAILFQIQKLLVYSFFISKKNKAIENISLTYYYSGIIQNLKFFKMNDEIFKFILINCLILLFKTRKVSNENCWYKSILVTHLIPVNVFAMI